LAGLHSQNLARSPGDNGVRVLPIVPRILLGSTSETTLSRLINLWTELAPIGEQPAFNPFSRSASYWFFPLLKLSNRVFARAEPQTHPITNPTRRTLLA
jgi:hypothetical protein